MAVKDRWKTFGKSVGRAFASFGRSMATTARVVAGSEERVDNEGNSNLKKAWSQTGRSCGTAGENLGKAAEETAEHIVKDEPNKEEESAKEPEYDPIIIDEEKKSE